MNMDYVMFSIVIASWHVVSTYSVYCTLIIVCYCMSGKFDVVFNLTVPSKCSEWNFFDVVLLMLVHNWVWE